MASQQQEIVVILKTKEDWEAWYQQLQSVVKPGVWKKLDPEQAQVPFLEPPVMPLFTQYRASATTFADLNQAERKDFMSAMQVYEVLRKEYNAEVDQVQKVCRRIQHTVSEAKKNLLPRNQSARDWLKALVEGTKPSDRFTLNLAGEKYEKATKPLQTTTAQVVLQWLEDWESAMAFGTRIRLPQALDENIWLKDFGRVVDNFAASFTDSYTMDLVRGKEGHTYTQVAREFRRWYSTKSYGAKGKKQSTMRGGAFAAQFGEEEAEPQGDGPEKGRKRQRALTATDLKPRKKKCPACEGPHAIADCWIVIESKRPDG